VGLSIARRALMVVCTGALLAVPAVAAGARGASADSPQGVGCNFRFGAISDQGAAGTLYYMAVVEPADPTQRCTTAVTFTVTATHGVPSMRYTTIDDNPLTATQTVSFTPGRLPPMLTIAWRGFHCADPAVAGALTFSAEGQTTSIGIAPSTCAGMAHSSFVSFPIQTPSSAVGIAPTFDNHGYRVLSDDGAVSHEGDATPLSFPFPQVCPAFGCLVPDAIAIVTTPTGNGAWVVTPGGGVFEYGTATSHGSLGAKHLNEPIVGIAAAPDGHGYWLTASDGGVFAFGSAAFHGSLGAKHLNEPIVGIAAAPDGHGYWLTASDGGVFAFGSAAFRGSMGGKHLNAPVVGIAAGPHRGYWLAGTDGSMFAFGGAPFVGSLGAKSLNAPVSAMAATSTGHGYWLLGADRGVFAFGDAHFYGTPAIFVP